MILVAQPPKAVVGEEMELLSSWSGGEPRLRVAHGWHGDSQAAVSPSPCRSLHGEGLASACWCCWGGLAGSEGSERCWRVLGGLCPVPRGICQPQRALREP